MKVAFWSNSTGRAGTTSNMACISILCAMLERKKSVLFENHYSLNGLEQSFMERKEKGFQVLKEEFAYYDPRGLDGLIRRVHSNYTYEKLIEDVSMKFLENLLYYLPKSHDMNNEYFEYELNQVVKPLIDFLNRTFDIVFVDTASNNSLSTKQILEESELVVVNLCQNKAFLDHFFSNYQSLFSKSIFLIGNYQEKLKMSLNVIRRRYQIPKERIAIVPFNLGFGEAVSTGKVVDFLLRNFTCKRQDENYYFMNQVKKATYMLLECLRREEASIVS